MLHWAVSTGDSSFAIEKQVNGYNLTILYYKVPPMPTLKKLMVILAAASFLSIRSTHLHNARGWALHFIHSVQLMRSPLGGRCCARAGRLRNSVFSLYSGVHSEIVHMNELSERIVITFNPSQYIFEQTIRGFVF